MIRPQFLKIQATGFAGRCLIDARAVHIIQQGSLHTSTALRTRSAASLLQI